MNEIPVGLIDPNPFQSRTVFDEEALCNFAETIQSAGLLNPPMVRPHPEISGRFQLVHGERRLRAVKLLGWQSVPCVVKELSDDEMIRINLIENIQREDLNPIEEAQGLKELRDSCGLSVSDIAEMLGKSRPWVSNSLRLLDMPFFLRACVLCKTLTAWHARVIKGLPEGYLKFRLADLVMDWFLSVDETREIVNAVKAGKRMVSWLRDVPVDALEVYMSRSYTSREVHTMTTSMSEEGLLKPVAVFTYGTIIDGVLRVNVARGLGWGEIRAWVCFDTRWFKINPESLIRFPSDKTEPPRRPSVAPPMSEEQSKHMGRLVEMLRAHVEETPGSPARWPILVA
jgi:ParB/RepB/Spo0J family partition protein